MKRSLITGGAGFIGFHLAKSLANQNQDVTILDNFERGEDDREFKELVEMPNVHFIKADITRTGVFENLNKDFDYIYHMAMINGTGNFYMVPDKVLKVGIIGTLNVLDWFVKQKKGKLLLTSSSETYAGALKILGDKFPIPTPEDIPLVIDDPRNVRWSYGGSKILDEIAMHAYAKAQNMENFVIIRYHNIYGPRMGFEHVIPQFIERVVNKETPFKIFGGEETRAFCYIDDCLRATQLIMESPKTNGETINVGRSDEEIKIIDVAKKLFEVTGTAPKLEILPAPEGSVMRRCPDTTKLKSLGFRPEISLEEGIRRTYGWYKTKFESRENLKKCHVCGSSNTYKFLSLGHHPPSDGFLTIEQLKKPEIHFPLDVYFCENCKLVQLGHAASPELLFTESFVYTTNSSKELVNNFQNLVEKIVGKFNLSKGDFVIDIGGNDGTLLENYLKYNLKVLNVDPSKAAEKAAEKNVPTLRDFFNKETSNLILNRYGRAKIITATNVFAHVKELNSFIEGVKNLLEEDGVFIEESHYIKNLISENEYDSIYAEHLRYYSLKSLVNLFEGFGMDVFDAEKISTHGGSLRVYACKRGKFKISENVFKILEEENNFGLHSKEIYESFGEKVVSNREKLRSILFQIKGEGKRVMGVGAPAKGNTLLNFCKIGTETIDCLLEYDSLKIGAYSPGMHIPIKDEQLIFQEPQPEYALILAWNLKDIIVPKLRVRGYRGKFIIPVPTPHIVD